MNCSFVKLTYLLIALCLLIFISCSPTKPTGKTISGKVTLEQTSDFSNVKVSIYNLPQIDTSISNALKKYLSLSSGIDLSIFLFDHRKQKPIAQTLTDKDGNFSISNIPDGEYIIFAQKEGYGWRYFKISTSTGNIQIYLNKEINISGFLYGEKRWSGDRNYIVDGDIEIPDGSSLYIENGCVIRFNGNFKIKVNGKLEIDKVQEQLPVVFTTDDTLNAWGGIYVSRQGQINLRYSVIRSASIGMFIDAGNASISNSVFIDNKNYGVSAVQIDNVKNVKIENCIFTGQPVGLNFEFTDTTAYVRNSIFVSNYEAGIYATTSSAKVENNYFDKNKYSINGYSNVGGAVLKIYQNDFASSGSYHINLRGLDSEIKYNEINSASGGISLGDMYLKKTSSVINYNNLQGKRYLVRAGSNTSNIDAKFNYWGTESEAEIRNLIFDRNDVSPSDPYYNSFGIVDYSNYFSMRIKDAGIK